MEHIKSAYSKAHLFIKNKALPYAKSHKVITIIALLIVIFGGYKAAMAFLGPDAASTYSLARVTRGDLKSTIVGSGQVSASNEIELRAKASGDITRISAKAGQEMKAGQIIAQIDTSDIAISLETARLNLQKVTAPAETSTVTQAQNALADAKQSKIEAETSLAKAYEDSFTEVSSTFVDLPIIIGGMDDLFYSQNGFLSDSNLSIMSNTAKGYRTSAGAIFDQASRDYDTLQIEYRSISRSTSTSSKEALIEKTYKLVSELGEALKNTNLAVDYIRNNSGTTVSSSGTAALSNINSWTSKNNGHLNGLISSRTAIENAKNNSITASRNIVDKTQSLQDINDGADPLDIRSQQLSVRQKELEYADYIIRAPFDGILAKLNVKVGDSASDSIGTFITKQKVAEITLNEVDAANVIAGQLVELTFDALDDVTATGTVASIDLVGTVTQGVVSYSAQIAFDNPDARIKPGMSVTATITTKNKADVVMVPSAAVKTRGNEKYVEVAVMEQNSGNTRNTGTSTNERMRRTSTSTPEGFSSTTASSTFTRGMTTGSRAGFALTGITLNTPPTERIVTVGDSSDTYVEILSGLEVGELVVTKTTSGDGAATKTTTNSLINVGGNRAVTRPATGGNFTRP